MDAERKRDMCTLTRLGAGAIVGAREGEQAVLHVAEAARVEKRLPGDAARAPVLLDAVGRRHAELAIELLVGQRTQRVLVEDRDLAPLVGVVQALDPDLLQSRLPERRAHRLLYRRALALPLNALELGARFGQLQRHNSGTDRVFIACMRKKTWSVPD